SAAHNTGGRPAEAGPLARRPGRGRSRRRGAGGAGVARADAMSLARPRFTTAEPGGRAGRRPVLITGGAGFVGTNLADRLLCQGRRVRIFDSLARPGSEANLRWLLAHHRSRLQFEIADLRDGARLRSALADI